MIESLGVGGLEGGENGKRGRSRKRQLVYPHGHFLIVSLTREGKKRYIWEREIPTHTHFPPSLYRICPHLRRFMSVVHLHGRGSSAFRCKFRNRWIWLSSVYSISVRCLPSIQVNEVNHSFSCIGYTYKHGS